MKNLVLSAVFILALAACKKSETVTTETTTTTTATEIDTVAAGTNQEEQLYSCSMHPDITGKQGDKCTECGMALTEHVEF